MDINNTNRVAGIGAVPPVSTTSPAASPANPIPGAPAADGSLAATYETGVQTVYSPNQARVAELWRNHEAQVESFRRMVEALITRQANQEGISVNRPPIGMFEVTEEARAEATEMIDEGGYYSVSETAFRILDFAVAITGGDPSRIDLMRDAVELGFAQAQSAFGGELPEISHQTLAAVMQGFDEWAAGGASSITLLNRE